jgi:hypothetical protein
MPTVTLELAQRANALALEVIERRAPQTPPPSSVDERITTALTDAARPLPFSELRGMCHVRTASLYERLAALMAAGRLVKSDHGYRLNDTLSAAARHHHQSRRRTVVTSASRMLYGASEAVVGSPAPPHRARLIPSFCSIGTILPSRPARRPCRRAQRRSRMARLRATASAARSVLDGREHDGMLGRVRTRSARTPIEPLKSARATPSKSVLTLIPAVGARLRQTGAESTGYQGTHKTKKHPARETRRDASHSTTRLPPEGLRGGETSGAPYDR